MEYILPLRMGSSRGEMKFSHLVVEVSPLDGVTPQMGSPHKWGHPTGIFQTFKGVSSLDLPEKKKKPRKNIPIHAEIRKHP